MTTTLGGHTWSYNEPNGLWLSGLRPQERARSAGSEVKDKQVGEHRGRIDAGSEAGGAHDTEAGPVVENLQPQKAEYSQLHPEQALARKQHRRQGVGLNAPVAQEQVGCHDVGTVQEHKGNQSGKGHSTDTIRQGPRELGATRRLYPFGWLCNTASNAGGNGGSRDRRLLGRTVAF